MKMMNTELENRIAKEFFITFNNTVPVSNKLYPNGKFKKNARSVSRYFSKWNKSGYLRYKRIIRDKTNKKGTKYFQTINTYKLNLNFYFDYAQEILKSEKFNSTEKKILNYIFSYNEVRQIVCKQDKLIQGINDFLSRTFLSMDISDEDILGLDFIKGFLVKNKRYLKKYKDVESQYREFWKISIDYGDKLRNKVSILSNFSEEDYRELKFKSQIRKYVHIHHIPYGTSEKDKKEILKRFSIVFNENRRPEITPWGSS